MIFSSFELFQRDFILLDVMTMPQKLTNSHLELAPLGEIFEETDKTVRSLEFDFVVICLFRLNLHSSLSDARKVGFL